MLALGGGLSRTLPNINLLSSTKVRSCGYALRELDNTIPKMNAYTLFLILEEHHFSGAEGWKGRGGEDGQGHKNHLIFSRINSCFFAPYPTYRVSSPTTYTNEPPHLFPTLFSHLVFSTTLHFFNTGIVSRFLVTSPNFEPSLGCILRRLAEVATRVCEFENFWRFFYFPPVAQLLHLDRF